MSRTLRVSGKSEARIENRESGIEDRLKNLENKRNKKIVDRGDVGRRL